MTLKELIQRLEELRDDFEMDGNTPITGAFQQNYPLLGDVEAVTTIIEPDDTATIYLALGGAESYGTGQEWRDDVMDLSAYGNIDNDDDCCCSACTEELNWIQQQVAAIHHR